MDRVLRRLAEARPFDVPPRNRARTSRKLILIPATALAAAVAVVAAIALTGGQSPSTTDTTTPPAPEAAAPKDARQVLLAAATRTEATQQSTGRYWLQKTENGTIYNVGDYKIMGRVAGEIWNPLSSQDPYVHCMRWLGFQPVTEADRAAWQRAGSPSTLHADRKQPTRAMTLEAGQRECKSRPGDGIDLFYISTLEYSLEQLRALPTDPAQLRAALERVIPDVDAQLLFLAAGDILVRVPAPPALRAAAYRMLADLPGVDYVEGVTDILGRSGSGVEHTLGRGPFRMRLVIDLSTGQTLANETRSSANGEFMFGDAVTLSELTDQAPPSA